jgi:hypothetical protein
MEPIEAKSEHFTDEEDLRFGAPKGEEEHRRNELKCSGN